MTEDIRRRLIEAADFMDQGKAVLVPDLLRQAAGTIAAAAAREAAAREVLREIADGPMGESAAEWMAERARRALGDG